jgi:hypothetical protein
MVWVRVLTDDLDVIQFYVAGLLVLIGMFATYLHCNKILKNQVALKVV